MGVTWTIVHWLVYHWLFTEKFSALIGSRKEVEVDNKAISSIFGKIRYLIYAQPKWLFPKNFKKKFHDNHMKLINPENGSVLYGESANPNFGRGHRCVTGDTLVLTDKGFMPIKKIVDEMYPYVIDENGEKKKILRYIKLPPEEIIKVRLGGNIVLKGTKDHPVKVLRNKKEIWVPLKDLKVGDKVKIFDVRKIPQLINSDYYRIEKLESKATDNNIPSQIPTVLNEDLAELIGLLISKGSIVNSSTIQFSNTNTKIIERFIELLRKNFGELKYSVRKNEEGIFRGHNWKDRIIVKKKPCYDVYIHSSFVKRLLANFGVGYYYANDKEVPFPIFISPQRVKTAFLRGLWIGDGSVCLSSFNKILRYTYHTSSKKLAEGVRYLLYSLGIFATVTERYDKRYGTNIYRVEIMGKQGEKLKELIGDCFRNPDFKSYKKPSREMYDSLFNYRNVRKIEKLPPEETYDLEVEGHNFVTNLIVSHNCSVVYMDELAYWPYLEESLRSVQDTSKVKIYVSTPTENQFLKRFVDNLREQGKVFTLHWKQHPFKDEEWYKKEFELRKEDPLSFLAELELSYDVDPKLRYYPEAYECQIEPIEFDPKLPLFASADFAGFQDYTALCWYQYDPLKNEIRNLTAIAAHGRLMPNKLLIDWWLPFLNPEIPYDKMWYNEYEREFLEKVRSWGKPKIVFGEPAHRQVSQVAGYSFETILRKNGINFLIVNIGTSHEIRKRAVQKYLKITKFNANDSGSLRLLDALKSAKISERSLKGTTEGKIVPLHISPEADLRSAHEMFCLGFDVFFKGNTLGGPKISTYAKRY
jgi:intein/homing endonuclease